MILDRRTAGLAGLEVLDTLRTTRRRSASSSWTASEQVSMQLSAIAAGAAGYLSKRSIGVC